MLNFLLVYLIYSYFLFILVIFFAWLLRKKKHFPNCFENKPVVSIVCVGRNEADHLEQLLQSVKHLTYNGTWEFIYIDDHSTDNTPNFFSKENPKIKYIRPGRNCIGKKNCLNYGVSLSNGEWIACVDADCILDPLWLDHMVSYAILNKKKWLGGIVVHHDYLNNHFLNNWQKVETLYLNIIGGVFSSFGFPFMANGANMIFKKEFFEPFHGKQCVNPSGDDILIALNFINKCGRKSIGFTFDTASRIRTSSPCEWKSFIQQKIRWASKLKHYNRIEIKIFTLYFALIQLSWILLVAINSQLWLNLTVQKAVFEVLLFSIVAKYYNVKQNLLYSLVMNVMYPYYSLIIGILAQKVKFVWKERTYYQ